jgi:hypothetical protein
MFCIGNVYLSDDIALAQFSCNLKACFGVCCVRGDAGAPVTNNEVPVLRKAWNMLKDELRPRAREVVETKGLTKGEGSQLELACTDGAACVFVQFEEDGTALCSIHKAFIEGRITWTKPLSCHLYPLRILESGQYDYVNFEYIPEMCSPACDHGKQTNTYLAEYLEAPLTRKYGPAWYKEFLHMCRRIREEVNAKVC